MPIFDIQAPDGKFYEVDGPNSAGALNALKQYLGQAAAPAAAQEESSTALGTAKALGTGVLKGGISLAGLPGDIREKLADIGEKFGVSRKLVSGAVGALPLMGAPSSEQLKGTIEGATGPLYQPKGTTEEVAQTVGEFLPGLIGGPETIAAKLGTRVLAPALASEAAGQITKGTEAEPYARAIGGLVGTGGAIRARQAVQARQIPKPSLEDIQNAGSQGYQTLSKAQIESDFAKSVSNQAQADLRRSKFSDKNGSAPGVFTALDELKTPAQGGLTHGFEDFQATRNMLQRLAGNYNNPVEQAAASQAISFLDRQLASVPQSALRNMNASDFAELLGNSRADYAVAKAGERVAQKLANAELQAASANSGMNLGNATRQKLRPLVTSAKGSRGFTDEEVNAIEGAVRGSPTGNTLRTVGNFLGGGMGLGGAVTAGGAYLASGNPLGLATPLIGYAAKQLGNRLTVRKANQIIDLIKTRSPTFQAYLASLPPGMSNKQIAARAIMGGLLGRTDQQSLLSPISQFQQ